MARVRFIGPEPVTVPELGRTVQPDELVEVPDGRFEGYVCQSSNWESVEEPKQEAAPAAPAKKAAARSAAPKGSDD
ncbi:hypothetical protein [Streptomyces lunaelactis]|uniref:hypothetical protein n=1 Tax=Streptomyces lunaelactis TaxID=1535768 RepID=UPI001585300F|nr:hypothetical protein [Streptomyces lunaelactis]NUL09068.1 hypothetical protein [Streptomyces lunaelactis]